MALAMLSLAEAPADDTHAHGHGKAEYFSSAFEGFLILVAAVSIGYAAVDRLLHPPALHSVGIGLIVSVMASLINLATARTLMKVGRQHGSITLEADAHHLFTDVWTSAGDRKSTRLNSSHSSISYAVFCLKKNTRSDMRFAVLTLHRLTPLGCSVLQRA